jgi:hypothetical protein
MPPDIEPELMLPELMLPEVEPEPILPDVPVDMPPEVPVPEAPVPEVLVELSVVPGAGAAGVVLPVPVPGAPEVPGGVAAPVAEVSGVVVVVPGEVVGLAFAS